jgi:bacteriorhodopsin
MENNTPNTSWFSILKLITKFIYSLINIFRKRDEIKKEEENKHHQQTLNELQSGYNKIDREKEE